MPYVKIDCFAFLDRECPMCNALKVLRCKNCEFYKTRERARKDYIRTRGKALHKIDKRIDDYFMNL